ncbi:uncharacterized protein BDR25DRAFT_304393 [Lindgomyces ingoldianus]|uniref:Uncharacterized protein n=1 Tax=Lindgomyces ingoldianus TaxID=673940 RepID=A0ACB6QS22_9PLEO|nr:uncharacterized protein BDR25DRAFT_304393 [Lindgomyces ingoldianus]KAF2469691.1 hypothetical protein BDR25DRAFT_304393 [Lindgomyces ingoldianus]
MDNSLLSSKRRKLDTPTRSVSSPLAKRPNQRTSGRLINRTTSLANGHTAEKLTASLRKSQGLRNKGSTPNGTTNRASYYQGQAERKDVYDDIDGALGVEAPAETPTRTQKGRPRKKFVLDPSLPHPFKKKKLLDAVDSEDRSDKLLSIDSTPRATDTNAMDKEQSVNRETGRSLLNDSKHGTGLEAGIQDELGDASSTPSRRKGFASVASIGAKNFVARTSSRSGARSSRKTGESAKEHEDSTQPYINGIDGTPSELRSSRRASASGKTRKRAATETEDDELAAATPSETAKHQSAVQDSEDDFGDRSLPSNTKSINLRRRRNRADHTSNRDEISMHPEDEQASDAPTEVSDHDKDLMDVDGGSALDPTEPSPFNIPFRKEKATAPLSGHLEPGRKLDLLKSIALERIMGKRPTPLIGLDEEYKTVHQLIEHTITAGEGNSMLLIGARGSGKTALVNKILMEISKNNSEEYHVVRLSGFIHTDDKIALREIWRQLGKEMDVEEDGGLSKNYADTLTTLLALLSHPSEQTGELTDQVAKAVVFIMDEFDLFAQHPRQTLLYNLFDIAQSRKAPIAVLGLTTRIDVANSLEKRVKSRFSHRYVHLSLAKTFTAFQEICKAVLIVQPEQLSVEERAVLGEGSQSAPGKGSEKGPKQDILPEWNANVSSLFASKSFLKDHLAPHFYCTKSISTVLTSFLLSTTTLSAESSSLNPSHLLSPPDSKLALLPTLSTLALSLLIAAARLDIIHDSDSCNFNMCYDEYVTLASKARIQSAAGGASSSGGVSKVWGKEVARREWEWLVELGLLMPVLIAGIGGARSGFAMMRCDVALEEIRGVLQKEKGVDKGLERWCRQL